MVEVQQEELEVVGLRFPFRVRLPGGNELVTNLVRNRGGYTVNDLKILDRFLKSGSTFLDMGAHFGWYSLVASRLVGPNGRVFAFEPEPGNRQLLSTNCEINNCKNISIVEDALSDFTGPAFIRRPTQNTGDSSLAHDSPFRRDQELHEVRTTRLDEWMSPEAFTEVSMIKMDVQGAEPALLRGAGTLFKNHRPPIILEYSPDHLHEHGASPFDIFSFMDRHGYLPFEIHDHASSSWSQLLTPISLEMLLQSTYRLLGTFTGIDLLLLQPEYLPIE